MLLNIFSSKLNFIETNRTLYNFVYTKCKARHITTFTYTDEMPIYKIKWVRSGCFHIYNQSFISL